MTDIAARIAALEQQRATMQLANRMVRKGNTKGLIAMGFTAEHAAKLYEPDATGQKGFADYTLRALSDKIADMKAKVRETV